MALPSRCRRSHARTQALAAPHYCTTTRSRGGREGVPKRPSGYRAPHEPESVHQRSPEGEGHSVGWRDAAPVVHIVADFRERPSETFAVFSSRSDVDLTVATLQFGDYSIAGQVSFERKTASDLGRSIADSNRWAGPSHRTAAP